MLGACSINKVVLMGNLTNDLELRQTANGFSTCRFTLAVTRGYQNQNGERETDFITCIAWRSTAEFICRNFSKGSKVIVTGELRAHSYEDRNHPDVRHYVTEVEVDEVTYGETRAAAQARGQNVGGQGGYNGGYQGGSQGGYQGGSQGSYQGGYQNQGGYQGGNNYQGGGYQNQGGYNSQPAHDSQQGQSNMSVGDLSDFTEVISDNTVLPF